MIRLCDLVLSTLGLIVLSPLLLVLIMIGFLDTGSPIFTQIRLGQHKRPFVLIKLRTMRLDTKSVASHLASKSAITKYGLFLRKTKLDELPQLLNVIKGDMSLVGPRPGLPNQQELTRAREAENVFSTRPGITGLAQIKNIDMSTPTRLAKTDKLMIERLTIVYYVKILAQTLLGAGRGDRIS